MTEKEFNHKVLPLAGKIYSFAMQMTGNQADAADITQEVMIKIWNSAKEWEKLEHPQAWAFKITRNLCLDWLKKQKPVCHDDEVLKNGTYDNELLHRIETQDTAEAVRRIIRTLPDNQREVMILREIEEMEYEEIAQITGLGLNNIRVLIARGRKKVKEILMKEYQVSKYEN